MPSSPISSTPRYVRVARALALITGLAGLSACGDNATAEPTDSGTGADSSTDSGTLADLGGETDSGAESDLGNEADLGTATDSGTDVDLGVIADGGGIDASAIACDACVCTGFGVDSDAGPVVSCEAVGRIDCCVAIGPLFPPDLPA